MSLVQKNDLGNRIVVDLIIRLALLVKRIFLVIKLFEFFKSSLIYLNLFFSTIRNPIIYKLKPSERNNWMILIKVHLMFKTTRV